MDKLRSYHCNICGAWLLIGEKHTCEIEKLEIIDRIANFFSQPHEDEHDSKDSLKELLNQVSIPKQIKDKA